MWLKNTLQKFNHTEKIQCTLCEKFSSLNCISFINHLRKKHHTNECAQQMLNLPSITICKYMLKEIKKNNFLIKSAKLRKSIRLPLNCPVCKYSNPDIFLYLIHLEKAENHPPFDVNLRVEHQMWLKRFQKQHKIKNVYALSYQYMNYKFLKTNLRPIINQFFAKYPDKACEKLVRQLNSVNEKWWQKNKPCSKQRNQQLPTILKPQQLQQQQQQIETITLDYEETNDDILIVYETKKLLK